ADGNEFVESGVAVASGAERRLGMFGQIVDFDFFADLGCYIDVIPLEQNLMRIPSLVAIFDRVFVGEGIGRGRLDVDDVALDDWRGIPTDLILDALPDRQPDRRNNGEQ